MCSSAWALNKDPYLCCMRMVRLLTITALIFLYGCEDTGLYQQVVFTPNARWSKSFEPRMSFSIQDTASSYRIFFLLRHSDAYPFSNIWVNVKSRLPGETVERAERFELRLATDDHWLGTGMDDLFDHRILLYRNPVKFSKPGDYSIRLSHDMRVEPLEGVVNLGLRIEKVN